MIKNKANNKGAIHYLTTGMSIAPLSYLFPKHLLVHLLCRHKLFHSH